MRPSTIHCFSSSSFRTRSRKSGPSQPGTYPLSEPGFGTPPEPPMPWQASQPWCRTSSRPRPAAASGIGAICEAAMK